jgi:hypothetical protein
MGRAVNIPNRRAAIETLIARGATEGERSAARAALRRLEAVAAARTSETERLLGFGYRGPTHAENDRMQLGGNHIEEGTNG